MELLFASSITNMEACMANVIKPFPDQQDLLNDIYGAWSTGAKNVLAVACTGFGKTLIKAFVAKEQTGIVVIFAHRDVLLSQISDSLASVGLGHKFVCSRATEREICDLQVKKYKRSYNNDSARIVVASVKTWLNRDTSAIAQHVSLWMIDEAHHVHFDNTWGQCVKSLPNAHGLGVTATPLRQDGKQLARKNGGVFDAMVKSIGMGELIQRGRLSPYKIYTIPSRLDLSSVKVTSSGDYNQKQLAEVSDKIDIIGDAVSHYKRLANGLQAITFCVSIEHANHVAEQFNAAGVNSYVLSSKTPLATRQSKELAFKQGKITNLINVDLFGEGYNVPKCSVVIMLRATKSYGLFKQQFGRMLRLAEGKPYGILIDHVGNVRQHCVHGEPHDDPDWLEYFDGENKKRKSSDDGDALAGRVCPECFGFYIPKNLNPKNLICPYCQHTETDEQRNTQNRELVVKEGDLVEYTSDYISKMLADRSKVDEPANDLKSRMTYAGAPAVAINGAVSRHKTRQEAQSELRQEIVSWCQEMSSEWNWDVETAQRMFEYHFGIDIFKAQTLSAKESQELKQKVEIHGQDERTIICKTS